MREACTGCSLPCSISISLLRALPSLRLNRPVRILGTRIRRSRRETRAIPDPHGATPLSASMIPGCNTRRLVRIYGMLN